MLNNSLKSLQNSILWAQQQDDMDILHLAREQMDTLLELVSNLPVTEQTKAHQCIDKIVPMEWPLWMEACRYQDTEPCDQPSTVH